MTQRLFAQVFSQVSLIGTLGLVAIGNVAASPVPAVQNASNSSSTPTSIEHNLTNSSNDGYLISEGLPNGTPAKSNYVGPTISLGNATAYGISAKFGVSDNISVRPFIQFASVGGVSGSLYGASATYDFSLPQSDFTPYAGLGYIGASVSVAGFSASGSGVYGELGADYNASDSIVLNGNYRTILSGGGNGYFSIAGGLRF